MSTRLKIYTKRGDQGQTDLYAGETTKRIAKDDPIIAAIGTLDEANCHLGIALTHNFPSVKHPFFLDSDGDPYPNGNLEIDLRPHLQKIQSIFFDLGAAVATPRNANNRAKVEKTSFDTQAVMELETLIDQLEKELDILTNFILPGGSPLAAQINLTRSIVRRAERLIVPLIREKKVEESVGIYLNRLSDFLFVAARYLNRGFEIEETKWMKL